MSDEEIELIREVLDVLIGCPAMQMSIPQLSEAGRDVLARYADFRLLGPVSEGTPGEAKT